VAALKYFKVLTPVQVVEDLKELLNQVYDEVLDKEELLKETDDPYEMYSETFLSFSQTIRIPQIAKLANLPVETRQILLLVILENQYFIKNYQYEIIAAVINSLTKDSLPLSTESFIEHFEYSWKQAFPTSGKPKSVWLFHYDCRFWLLLLRIIVKSVAQESPDNARKLAVNALEKVLNFKSKFKGYGHYPEVAPLICILLKLGDDKPFELLKEYCREKIGKVYKQLELLENFPVPTDELVCLFLKAHDYMPYESWMKDWQKVFANTTPMQVRNLCKNLWENYMPSQEEVEKLAHLSGGTLDMEIILTIQRQLYQDFQDITEYEELGRNITKAALWSYSLIDSTTVLDDLTEFSKRYYQFKDFIKAAIYALENIESPESLALLQKLQHQVLDREVKKLIHSALSKLGSKQGLSVDDLKDLTTDDCGLDVNGKHPWVLGRDYVVTMALESDGSITLNYLDKSTNEKTLDTPEQLIEKYPQEYENIKETFQLLQSTYNIQSKRLETAMCQQRSWHIALWRDIFEDNALNFNLACRLIWGIFDNNDKLITLLRPQRNNKFENLDGTEVSLPPKCFFKIVHPAIIETDILNQWKEKLSDKGILQPFSQINRKTYPLKPEEKGETISLQRFKDIQIPFNLFQEKMHAYGWSGFTASDFESENKYKDYETLLWRASINIDMTGINIWTVTSNVTLGEITFTKISKRGKQFKPVEKNKNNYLEQVCPIVFSETIADVMNAIGNKKISHLV
jgi:hypothetical protein